jgi:hypothetical protein
MSACATPVASPLTPAFANPHPHPPTHPQGGLISEAATVESVRFAEAHGMRWRCVSFESPGLPQHYMRAALRQRPEPGAWDDVIKGYLAAPNPINMLYPHLGEAGAPWAPAAGRGV